MPGTAPQTDEDDADGVVPASGDGEATVRDRVWATTLELLSERPAPFRVTQVRERAGFDSSRDRTIRRTLRAMTAAGWLEHEDGSEWWHPGAKAREHLTDEYPVSFSTDE